ncbi:ORF31 [callitrichine gammaherpesvirus 3]|uniref:ORF31 n=1 Tax=callitrichine gammaherpesvirus 3 TaxID=106331 RepID=Q993H9_9GAMA|nr:ORF31 [callitrichine gammaherpesvirus 3]AAK38239.1 ORF31 [callitrichine gammaherpesvirus 3]
MASDVTHVVANIVSVHFYNVVARCKRWWAIWIVRMREVGGTLTRGFCLLECGKPEGSCCPCTQPNDFFVNLLSEEQRRFLVWECRLRHTTSSLIFSLARAKPTEVFTLAIRNYDGVILDARRNVTESLPIWKDTYAEVICHTADKECEQSADTSGSPQCMINGSRAPRIFNPFTEPIVQAAPRRVNLNKKAPHKLEFLLTGPCGVEFIFSTEEQGETYRTDSQRTRFTDLMCPKDVDIVLDPAANIAVGIRVLDPVGFSHWRLNREAIYNRGVYPILLTVYRGIYADFGGELPAFFLVEPGLCENGSAFPSYAPAFPFIDFIFLRHPTMPMTGRNAIFLDLGSGVTGTTTADALLGLRYTEPEQMFSTVEEKLFTAWPVTRRELNPEFIISAGEDGLTVAKASSRDCIRVDVSAFLAHIVNKLCGGKAATEELSPILPSENASQWLKLLHRYGSKTVRDILIGVYGKITKEVIELSKFFGATWFCVDSGHFFLVDKSSLEGKNMDASETLNKVVLTVSKGRLKNNHPLHHL